jgi:hypothetical protein
MIQLRLSDLRKLIFLGIITEADEDTMERFYSEYGYDKVAYSMSTNGHKNGLILREDSTGKFFAILGVGRVSRF